MGSRHTRLVPLNQGGTWHAPCFYSFDRINLNKDRGTSSISCDYMGKRVNNSLTGSCEAYMNTVYCIRKLERSFNFSVRPQPTRSSDTPLRCTRREGRFEGGAAATSSPFFFIPSACIMGLIPNNIQ